LITPTIAAQVSNAVIGQVIEMIQLSDLAK
jgi:hypothetical protein